MKILFPIIFIIAAYFFVNQSDEAATSLSSLTGINEENEKVELQNALKYRNLYAEGFVFSSGDQDLSDLAEESGHRVHINGLGYFGAEFARYSDLKKMSDGYTVFAWPESSEVIDRDYDRLGELMTEYGSYVGTLLKKDPKGAGEKDWKRRIRRMQNTQINVAIANKDSGHFCKEVVHQLVESYVKGGSEFRQYGNCGEGQKIGTCLAKRAGFEESEIRVCRSLNDHYFSMVREPGDDPNRKWCLLDRWNIIGYFRCGVEVSEDQRVILEGSPVESTWFKRVECTTFDKFIESSGRYVTGEF